MNTQDFNRMMSLISKLKVAINHAKRTDSTFTRYHSSSISFIDNLESHMDKIESGLTTAKILKPGFDAPGTPLSANRDSSDIPLAE